MTLDAPTTTAPTRETLTLEQLAARWQVSRRDLARRIKDGRLPVVRLGPRTVRVLVADVKRLEGAR